ncbi:MAG: CDP-alcohol phosphatidyltransferase family protein [Bradymonadaceae bacterium]
MDLSSIWAGVVPGLIIMGGLILALVYYLVRIRPHRAAPRGAKERESTALVPSAVVDFFYTLLDPLMARLERHQITPNQITSSSLVLACTAALLFGLGYWLWGAWVFALSAAGDGLDGMLARQTGRTTRSGAFFDSFMDRLSEGAVFLGIAVYGQGGWLTWTAISALIASYAVSYARARGEALGVDCRRGLMQRPERMVLIFFLAWGSPYLALYLEPGVDRPVYHLAIAGTTFIALSALWTAIIRARFIFETLRSGEVPRDLGRTSAEESIPAHLKST